MALGELDVEVGDHSVDVVVPVDLQAEGGREGQVLSLHCVDVYFLQREAEPCVRREGRLEVLCSPGASSEPCTHIHAKHTKLITELPFILY